MTVGDNIRILRMSHNLTQQEFADKLDVTREAVGKWENGSMGIRDRNIVKMVEVFGVEPDDVRSENFGLASRKNTDYRIPANALMPKPSTAYAPLLGRVHAGDATEPEILDDHIPVPQEILDAHPNGYYLEVEGDCMDKVYPPGCHIFIDPDREPQSGSIAAVMIDGHDAVMRRLYRGATTLVLSPESDNPEHEDIVIGASDERTVELVGTVVWFQAAGEME